MDTLKPSSCKRIKNVETTSSNVGEKSDDDDVRFATGEEIPEAEAESDAKRAEFFRLWDGWLEENPDRTEEGRRLMALGILPASSPAASNQTDMQYAGQRVPEEVVEAIRSSLGHEAADDVAHQPGVAFRKCMGKWDCLRAAAKEVAAKKKKTRVGSPIGLLYSKALEFAENGIPPKYRAEPSPEPVVYVMEPTTSPKERALSPYHVKDAVAARAKILADSGKAEDEIRALIIAELDSYSPMYELTAEQAECRRTWATDAMDKFFRERAGLEKMRLLYQRPGRASKPDPSAPRRRYGIISASSAGGATA